MTRGLWVTPQAGSSLANNTHKGSGKWQSSCQFPKPIIPEHTPPWLSPTGFGRTYWDGKREAPRYVGLVRILVFFNI